MVNKYFIVLVLGLFAPFTQAATLNVVGGELFGASDVEIDGALYDVEFIDGTCIALFGGCDELSDFVFNSEADVISASQALLDQVFVNGPLGNFDSDLKQINGCDESATPACEAYTPYGFFGPDPGTVTYGSARNVLPSTSGEDIDIIRINQNVPIANFVGGATSVYAVWSPVSPVPVPAAVWLFGTAIVGLVGFGRRRKGH